MLPTLGSYTAGNSVCNATNVQAIKSKRILGFQALDYDIVDNYVGDLLGAIVPFGFRTGLVCYAS